MFQQLSLKVELKQALRSKFLVTAKGGLLGGCLGTAWGLPGLGGAWGLLGGAWRVLEGWFGVLGGWFGGAWGVAWGVLEGA